MEQTLLEILEKKGLKKWWDPFQKSSLKHGSMGATCGSLGKIEAKELVQVLNKLEKSLKGPLIPKVKEALKKIEERMGTSKL